MYARGLVSRWPDLVIKSTVEPKRFHILDVRNSSFEVDRRVPGNRDEVPFPLPSCLYRAIFLHCCCAIRESSVVHEKLSSQNIPTDFIVTSDSLKIVGFYEPSIFATLRA